MTQYQLPVPSTELRGEVEFCDRGALASLAFCYEQDGIPRHADLRFEKVRAYRHRAEVHCTAWHVENAYDQLAEMPDSDWANELRRETSPAWKDYWTLRHFMIYFDSWGCFEILAASWKVVEEDLGAAEEL